jgi:hypothetical protein
MWEMKRKSKRGTNLKGKALSEAASKDRVIF